MKIIFLNILVWVTFISQLNGAFAENSTAEHVRQLNVNLVAEQTYLAELKALLKTPPFKDKTSQEAKNLSDKINESRQLISLLKETLRPFLHPKFHIIYVGFRSKQSSKPSQPDDAECLNQLLENLKNEQTYLSELKVLLTTCPDKTSPGAQKLRNKIKECLRILNYFNDCLIDLMYPSRLKENLLQEAQQNCLWYVKLVLHSNGCFHIPKLVKTPPLKHTD